MTPEQTQERLAAIMRALDNERMTKKVLTRYPDLNKGWEERAAGKIIEQERMRHEG